MFVFLHVRNVHLDYRFIYSSDPQWLIYNLLFKLFEFSPVRFWLSS